MTIQEAILSYPGLSDIESNFVEKVLADRSIDGTATYSADDSTNVALCAADCFTFIVNSPDFSEGELSVKINRKYARQTAIRLYRENGEEEKADALRINPTISSPNLW